MSDDAQSVALNRTASSMSSLSRAVMLTDDKPLPRVRLILAHGLRRLRAIDHRLFHLLSTPYPTLRGDEMR
jgi:hypothetical protein